ncbi:MAG: histidine triad nucleotide-binding protein [Candidatus Thiodiazotropha endolucinida]
MTTLFEKIIAKEIPSDIIYEDEFTIAINDISPQAPIHILVIPKLVSESVHEADNESVLHCLKTIRKIAEMKEIQGSGYRVVTNVRNDGGQSVPHLHFHVLGGARVSNKIA